MRPSDWVAICFMLGVVALFVIAFLPRKPHKHAAQFWDGHYEHCRCGACAGDRRDPKTGQRYSYFDEWGDQ